MRVDRIVAGDLGDVDLDDLVERHFLRIGVDRLAAGDRHVDPDLEVLPVVGVPQLALLARQQDVDRVLRLHPLCRVERRAGLGTQLAAQLQQRDSKRH